MTHHVSFHRLLLATVAAGVALTGLTQTATAAERLYHIAAVEVDWNYAPSGRNMTAGRDFNEDEEIFVAASEDTMGGTYRKVVYRQYTDATFTQQVARPPEWEHLGLLGPTLHAEVGDTIRIVFHNMASRPYSMHPHGVFYTKAHEGDGYADGTTGDDRNDDSVAPGDSHTYVWNVPDRAGPAEGDGSSIPWLYHSHADLVRDTNSGLMA